jgi:hypothetical protein
MNPPVAADIITVSAFETGGCHRGRRDGRLAKR